MPLSHPVEVPPGSWVLTLQTTWSEPAYVEPDASWCAPGGVPTTPVANGGAFGGKRASAVPGEARRLAERTGRPARVLWRREDVVRRGPKRPPLAVALRADGSGCVRLGRSPGSPELSALVSHLRTLAPGLEVEEVPVVGPPVSSDLRGAGWAEVLAALAALAARRDAAMPTGAGRATVSVPGGGRATVEVDLAGGGRGRVGVEVWAGAVLSPVTLRSYALGAVHHALGLVWSEGIAVDAAGEPVDLTIRSFGILASRDMPDVGVTIHAGRALARQRLGRGVRRHARRRLDRRGMPATLADAARRHALAAPGRDTIAPSRGGDTMSPAVGPYSPVRRVGDWVVTSGQVGLVTDDSGRASLAEGGTIPELRQALRNLAEVLAVEGATLSDVVKTTLFLVDMGDYATVNEVWMEHFTGQRPTRSAVAVAALPVGARVEVEAWAYAPVV